jgi:hypothetical protein
MTATDTLSGAYGAAKITMPDGTEVPVLVRKIVQPDGKAGWLVIDDKVMAYEASLGSTDFKPNDQLPPNTEVLHKNTTITTGNETRREISADLIQFLGDPDRIIAQKGLDSDRISHMKAHPASLTMARRLCELAGSKWIQVLQYLPKFYPERP